MAATPHKIQGYQAQVGYTTTSGGVVANFGSLQNFDVSVKTDQIDASDHDGQGWKNKLPGMSEWTATAKKLYIEGGTSDADILSAITGKTLVYFTFYPEVGTVGGGERSYTGQGYIVDFKHAGQNNDCEAIDLTIMGDGPLVETPQ